MNIYIDKYLLRGSNNEKLNEQLIDAFEDRAGGWDDDFNGNNGDDYYTRYDAVKDVKSIPHWYRLTPVLLAVKLYDRFNHDPFYSFVHIDKTYIDKNTILLSVICGNDD